MLYTNAPMEELERSGSQFYLNLKPVNTIFLSSEYNRIMNIVFLAFAFIMLAVAVLNYILLVVSSVVKRAKSIATYRCYGAESKDIYRMILAESVLHCFIALILAVQDIVSRTMPSQEKHVYSLDLEMTNQYNMLLHVRNSILFVGLCILVIALIGLIAYIRDEVNRRRSEIAIRIIHGAQVKDVQLIFLKDILKIAIPAVLTGSIFAIVISTRLLELFATKISLTWYLFGGCVLAVLIIIFAISCSMILKAAHSNPISNLRTE